MEKLQTFFDEHLGPIMTKIGTNRYLLAVRDGVVSALPLIIVGSFYLIVAIPPLPEDWAIYQFLTSNATTILLPYRMTMYIMTVYAVFGMGHSLARSYDLDGLTGGVLSAAAFLLTNVPVYVEDASLGLDGYVLPMANLGGSGLFIGILMSFFAVNVFRLTQNSKFHITMPPQVPPAVAKSFAAFTPTLIVMLVVGSITYFVGFDWHGILSTIISPLISATDTLPGVLIIIFGVVFFWFFGIHGDSIVGSVARPLWLALLEQNAEALAAGTPSTAISAEPFYQWFVHIGGSGTTIGLALALVFVCRSKYLQDLGRIAVFPAIFNINEPLIFGVPIVLNFTFIIPFVLTPMICGVIAWFATSLGFVNAVVVTAPWTLPGPIGAYLACGGDWRAAVLNLILVAISFCCYLPFVKMYDKQMCGQEAEDSDSPELEGETA